MRGLGRGRPLSDVPCRRTGHPDTRSPERHRLPPESCRGSRPRAVRSRPLSQSLRTPSVVHPVRPGDGLPPRAPPGPLRLEGLRTVGWQQPPPEHLASYPRPLRRRRSGGPRDSSCALVVHDLHTPFTAVHPSRTPMRRGAPRGYPGNHPQRGASRDTPSALPPSRARADRCKLYPRHRLSKTGTRVPCHSPSPKALGDGPASRRSPPASAGALPTARRCRPAPRLHTEPLAFCHLHAVRHLARQRSDASVEAGFTRPS